MRDACLWAMLIVCVSAGPGLSQWTEPVPVTEVNLEGVEEWSPFLSSDGLTLYFARVRSPEFYEGRIFQATRARPEGSFTAVAEVPGPLNSSLGHVLCPWVSPDNLRLYYNDQVGSVFSLKMSARTDVDEPWPQGVDLAELNALGRRLVMPRLTADEMVVTFQADKDMVGRGGYDLWMAERPDRHSPFTNVSNLATVNSRYDDISPYISPEGLQLYFASDRTGSMRLYVAERTRRDKPFGFPKRLRAFDMPGGHSAHPSLSSDGTALYFQRQAGSDGATRDIFVSYVMPTYYVDAARGRDTNSGVSPCLAFASIQKAIEVAQAGDVINVGPGRYREELDFLGKAITVQSVGDAAVLEAPERFAVSFYRGEGRNAVLRNLIIAHSFTGIFCAHSSPTITNVTVVGNVYGVEAYGRALPRITNSILWDNSDSDIYGCQATYSCIERGGEGGGNFTEDPLFVDPEDGDYHVRSERGRYWPEHDIWVLDDVTSPCVDAGDPPADFSAERKPNGGRINVGAHGGTAHAAISDPEFSLDVNGDGLVDTSDLEMYTDLWQQQTQPPPARPPGRLR
jgi:hypothetical protein